jgi:inner membrane transporter RhtA
VARRLFDAIGPTSTVFLRVAFGALILLGIARPLRPKLTSPQWQSVLLFGITIAAMNFCFYQAIARIPLGIAVAIEFIGPLGVAVAGSRSALDFVWVALAALGVAMLSLVSGSVTLVGVLFALAAAAGWATYIVLSQRVGRLVAGPDGLALALTVGGLALAPFGIAAAGVRLFDLRILSVSLVVAVLSTAIPFSLEFAALRRLSRKAFGILMSLEPAMGAAAGFVLLGQRLAIRDLIAIALVIVASIGATANARRPAPAADVP